MHVLYVYRHAKASRDDPTLEDHARPLTDRGAADAEHMAKNAKQLGIKPQLIWCSTAKRARQTLDPMLPELKKATVEHVDWLYDAGPDEIIRELCDVDDSVDSVMVVGHNPTFQELAVELAAGGDRLAALREKMATGSIAVIELPDSWAKVKPQSGQLAAYIEPKQLK